MKQESLVQNTVQMAPNAEQMKVIQQAIDAGENRAKRAEYCAAVRCFVLAREYEYFAQRLKAVAEWQRKALTPSGPTKDWVDGPVPAPPGPTSGAEQLNLE